MSPPPTFEGSPTAGATGIPSATVQPTPVATAPATPEPSTDQLGVLGVTFVSPTHAWVLVSSVCSSGACLRILETTDGGATWSDVQPPPVRPGSGFPGAPGASSIRFATAIDGWVFGPSLWATHDDGMNWTEVQVPGFAVDSIEQLEVVGSVAVTVGSKADPIEPAFQLAEASIGGDDWHVAGVASPYGAGPEPTPTLISTHGTAWYMQVDRVPVDGARRIAGTWQAWQPPCFDEGGPAVLAAASATSLVAACNVGAWGPSAHGLPAGERLFVSKDAGATFDAMAGTLPVGTVRSIAMASPSVIVAVGIADTGDELLRSGDGGTTWATVAHLDGRVVRYLAFTTATQGVAILDTATNGFLMTHDAGLTWQAIHL